MAFASDGTLNLAVERSYNTLLTNSTLLPLLLLSLARQKNSPETSSYIKNEYDYVIVGAGTAGSVVAARLSEIPCVSVLLLEAGPPPPKLNDIIAIGRNFWFTDLDWQYKTAPQRYMGRGLINRQVTWPSGKGLGGSSLLNGAFHVRGNRKDYDDWEAMGATGWSYKDVLPYFKKLEDNRDPEYVANGYHGVGGPITTMRPSYQPEIKDPIFWAARSMGYQIVDPNGKRQTGFFDLQGNLRDNQRCSTAKAYLVPADYRRNLDILPNAMVERVLIKNRRATGVLFSHNGYKYEVQAKREIIMSAGAINTPQLLMLSGIGPKEELQRFNIPVHADLPVGQNLQDHGGATVDFVLSPYITEFTQKLSDPQNIKRYIHNRTGPLASTEGVTNIAFLLNDEIRSKRDEPNYELYFSEGSTTIPKEQWNLKPEVYEQVYGPYENQPLLICFSQQLSPKSRGSVTLQSADPYDEPVIDPNYFKDPQDIKEVVEGMKTCKRIINSPHLKKVGARPLETLYPGCEKYAHEEDKYFECQARTVLLTLSHPCGTTKMGNPRDPSTVVDPKLRVKHIQGLRVVDNSIMPKIVHGNTGVPAIMIGEKAADIIKETIHCHKSIHNAKYYGDNLQKRPEFPDYEHTVKQHEPDLLSEGEYGAGYEEVKDYLFEDQANDNKNNMNSSRPFPYFNQNDYNHDKPDFNPPLPSYAENYDRGKHQLQPQLWENSRAIPHHVAQRPDQQNWYLDIIKRNS